MKTLRSVFFWLFILFGIAGLLLNGLALSVQPPDEITYGATFSVPYAKSLGLDWRAAYNAMLTDLEVDQVRLAAYWPMVEPQRGEYTFTELDYQIKRAREEGATVILAVGRRLPRWPECHHPEWTQSLSRVERQAAQKAYMRQVVERYRDEPHIELWQVENEPYLEVFAHEHCGELDEQFLREEVALVREADPDTPILMTDSGNLGTWWQPYRLADAFGTSVYLYFWHDELGKFTTDLPAAWYRAKHGAVEHIFGDKPTFLIELAAEPWLPKAKTDVPIDVQLQRMNPQMLRETIRFARRTHLPHQYLWGVEWWYWLKIEHDHDAMWQTARRIFSGQ